MPASAKLPGPAHRRPAGRVTGDRDRRYAYDPMGRQSESRDGDGVLREWYLYGPSGARVARVACDADGAPDSVTTTLRGGGGASWEETKSAAGGLMERHRYIGPGPFMDGGSTRASYIPDLPATPAYVAEFAPGAEVCAPDLSEPSWALRPGGALADATYAVLGLCEDVAWVEVRKSRLKDSGKAPCGGSSCEDQVEVRRFERPEGGWG